MEGFEYEGRGNNCLDCGSTLEPNGFLCTTCDLARKFGAMTAAVGG